MEEAAKPLIFEGFKAGCNVVLHGRRGTLLHSHVSEKMSKVVLRDRRNTSARFSEYDLHFSWHALHFGRVHFHSAWQAQHFGHVVPRVFREPQCQGCVRLWQHASRVVTCSTSWECHFAWPAQNLVKIRRVWIVILHGRRSIWDALHFTLYTCHSTLYILHFARFTLHSTLYPCTVHFTLYLHLTPHSTLETPHSTLYTWQLTLHTLHFTLRTLNFTLHTLHLTLDTPHSTLYTAHSTLYTWHSTLHTWHCTLYTPHFTLRTLHSTLYTLHLTPQALHPTLYTLHSALTLYALHLTLYTPHFTLHALHATLYTLCSTLNIVHSTLFTLHFALYTLHSALPTLHFILYTLHLAFTLETALYTLHLRPRTLHFTLYTWHSTRYTSHLPLDTPRSTLYTLNFTFYTLHCALHALRISLWTLLSTLSTLHFTLDNPHSTLYTAYFTLHFLYSHFTLYILYLNSHFTFYTLQSALNTPLFSLSSHSTLCTPPHSTLHSLHWYGNRGRMYKTVEISCFTKIFYVTGLRFVYFSCFFNREWCKGKNYRKPWFFEPACIGVSCKMFIFPILLPFHGRTLKNSLKFTESWPKTRSMWSWELWANHLEVGKRIGFFRVPDCLHM